MFTFGFNRRRASRARPPMKTPPDEVRTDLRSRWRSYLAAAALAVGLPLLLAALVWWRANGAPARAVRGEPAFPQPQWRCANVPEHEVCWRELPPARPRADRQAAARPAP
jgi:hypothetical protein